MPQMSPMLWMWLYLYTILLMLLFMIILYYLINLNKIIKNNYITKIINYINKW